MRELGIRQWWLAEQLRVDRKTISRWLTGKVRNISADNLTNLAGILGCPQEDLIADDPAAVFASIEDQSIAAKLIDEKSLIEALAPSGQWELAEALIKAVMRPELPIFMLGQLYNSLSIAAWRRSNLTAAEKHAQSALELGYRSDNKSVIATAHLNLGTILGIRGQIDASISTYNQALELLHYLDEPLERGKALSNLGTDYLDYGDNAQCIEFQNKAIAEFSAIDPLPRMNLAIAYTNLARSQLALALPEAKNSTLLAQEHATRGNYLRGIAFADLLHAELLARDGHVAPALAKLESGLKQFTAQSIYETLNYVLAARVYRLTGDSSSGMRYLEKGLALKQVSEVNLAELHLEAAKLLRQDDPQFSEQHVRKAAQLFNRCGCRQQAEHCLTFAKQSGMTL